MGIWLLTKNSGPTLSFVFTCLSPSHFEGAREKKRKKGVSCKEDLEHMWSDNNHLRRYNILLCETLPKNVSTRMSLKHTISIP
uniref:Uncharacterized protein n=1 Tax=Lepeophtheirus salmonis TaxID=72036 RepID=A0A0K2UWN3_LEPSM